MEDLAEITSHTVDRDRVSRGERLSPTSLEIPFCATAIKVVGFQDHRTLGAMIVVRHVPVHVELTRSGPLDAPLGRRLTVQWVPECGTEPGPLWRYVGTYFRADGNSLKHDPLHVYVHGEVE